MPRHWGSLGKSVKSDGGWSNSGAVTSALVSSDFRNAREAINAASNKNRAIRRSRDFIPITGHLLCSIGNCDGAALYKNRWNTWACKKHKDLIQRFVGKLQAIREAKGFQMANLILVEYHKSGIIRNIGGQAKQAAANSSCDAPKGHTSLSAKNRKSGENSVPGADPIALTGRNCG